MGHEEVVRPSHDSGSNSLEYGNNQVVNCYENDDINEGLEIVDFCGVEQFESVSDNKRCGDAARTRTHCDNLDGRGQHLPLEMRKNALQDTVRGRRDTT